MNDTSLDWKVVVTTAPEKAPEIDRVLSHLGVAAEVDVYENRGRDILPFLQTAARLRDEGTEVVLKLHTKHSPHRSDGNVWRTELLRALASRARASRILDRFHCDENLGIVAAEGHIQPLTYYWGANAGHVRHLLERLGQPLVEPDRATFVAGSMFWCRLAALDPLLDAGIAPDEFEPELGQVDGTLAHAMERVMGLCVEASGMHVKTAAAVCGEQEPLPADYRFAARG